MGHAEVCPICHGKGTIPTEDGTGATRTCYGCNGRGWVEVNDIFPVYPRDPVPPIYPWWGNPIYYCCNR